MAFTISVRITEAVENTEECYRKAISNAAALEELCRNAGTQFDPDLVEKFVKIIMSHPTDRQS